MANECNNSFTVTHNDTAMLGRFEAAFTADKLFDEFCPIPEELKNNSGPFMDDVITSSNLEKYGSKNTYYWSINNWGTKWDVGISQGDIKRYNMELTGWFVTAWSPPIKFFMAIKELGFTFRLVYDEPGLQFVGVLSWDETILRDECYSFNFDELTKANIDWREVIPEELHEVIKDYYYDWLEGIVGTPCCGEDC